MAASFYALVETDRLDTGRYEENRNSRMEMNLLKGFIVFTWWHVGVGVAGRVGCRIDGRVVVTRRQVGVGRQSQRIARVMGVRMVRMVAVTVVRHGSPRLGFDGAMGGCGGGGRCRCSRRRKNSVTRRIGRLVEQERAVRLVVAAESGGGRRSGRRHARHSRVTSAEVVRRVGLSIRLTFEFVSNWPPKIKCHFHL